MFILNRQHSEFLCFRQLFFSFGRRNFRVKTLVLGTIVYVNSDVNSDVNFERIPSENFGAFLASFTAKKHRIFSLKIH